MGLKERLARRRAENRIRRGTRRGYLKEQPRPDDQIDDMLRPYVNTATRVVRKTVNITQARKAEGKVILKSWIKHGIGEGYRGVMGPRPSDRKKKNRRTR